MSENSNRNIIPKYHISSSVWQPLFDKDGAFMSVRKFVIYVIQRKITDKSVYFWYSSNSADIGGPEWELFPTEEAALEYAYLRVRKLAGALYSTVKGMSERFRKKKDDSLPATMKPGVCQWIKDAKHLQAGMLAWVDDIGWAVLGTGGCVDTISIRPAGLSPTRELDLRAAEDVPVKSIRMAFRLTWYVEARDLFCKPWGDLTRMAAYVRDDGKKSGEETSGTGDKKNG